MPETLSKLNGLIPSSISLRYGFFSCQHYLAFHFNGVLSISRSDISEYSLILFLQGMSYLHAKGIVLPALTTMNVFLESKVKLCVSGYCNRTKRVER